MDYNRTAAEILDAVGGRSNVAHLHHCATRLRFTLHEPAQADLERLKGIKGVLAVVTAGSQPQVVIGGEVVEIYAAAAKQLEASPGGPAETSGEQVARPVRHRMRPGAVLLDFLVGVFQPLIPAMAGAGILKSLLLLLSLPGWITKTDPTYTTLVSISDATFYFLPLMVAVTAATKLGANKIVALAAVSVLLLPTLTTAIASDGGTSVFGLAIPNVNYAAQVFPAILSVLLLSYMERFWTKVVPKAVRVFGVPMLSFLVTVPATLLLLGPLGFWAGIYFTEAILFLNSTLGWVAYPLLAMALPFAIAIGMHKALTPYAVQQLSATGSEGLLLPALLAHNMSQAGASLAVALRTKSSGLRATAISGGISALFGITEPALYGVTLQNKRALYSVLAGACAGGLWVGINQVTGHVLVTPGLASLSLFVSPDNPLNIVNAIIGAAIALVVSGIAAFFLWSDTASGTLKASAESQETPAAVPAAAPVAATEGSTEAVVSPVSGKVIALSETPDKVFAGGALGPGVAIQPASGTFHSPAAGEVKMIFDTKHAVAVVTDEGAEILIHIGLDTVRLDGKHFTAHVSKGDRVEAGQPLITADLDAIAAAGYKTVTPVVITNSRKFDVSDIETGDVNEGDRLFEVAKKEAQHARVS